MNDYTLPFNLKRKSELSHMNSNSDGQTWNKREALPNGKKTKGRVKIKMEFIDNKLRRYTTFSKRKTGIMKKAYELSTLTGTQVMLLVASETGHVYTFATKKLQPMITSEAGKALIQTCLNTPEEGEIEGKDVDYDQRMSAAGFEETELSYAVDDKEDDDDDYEVKYDLEDSGEPASDEEDPHIESNETPTNLSIHNNSTSKRKVTVTTSVGLVQPPVTQKSNDQHCRDRQGRVDHTEAAVSQSTDKGGGRELSKNSTILAPSLPPEILAQLGYTSLLAQASSGSNARLVSLQRTERPTFPAAAGDDGGGFIGTRLASLLPREPVPQVSLIKLEPAQSPENLSLHRKT